MRLQLDLSLFFLYWHAEWINYIYYNQQRFINYTDDALTAFGEQLHATSRMAWQNRQALDVLVEKGGVCMLFGEQCCSFIPNSTGPDGSFTRAMKKLKGLRQEVDENAGFGHELWDWLDTNFGKWEAWIAKIAAVAVMVIILLALLVCLFSRVVTRQMLLQTVVLSSAPQEFTLDLLDLETGEPVPDAEDIYADISLQVLDIDSIVTRLV